MHNNRYLDADFNIFHNTIIELKEGMAAGHKSELLMPSIQIDKDKESKNSIKEEWESTPPYGPLQESTQ